MLENVEMFLRGPSYS